MFSIVGSAFITGHRSRYPDSAMFASENFSFVRRISQAGTYLRTLISGVSVGRDEFGNRYYRERGKPRAPYGGRVRQKRWVLYKGAPEPTKVPPEWHMWLHYMADAPLHEDARKPWQKPYEGGFAATPVAREAENNYQAWKP